MKTILIFLGVLFIGWIVWVNSLSKSNLTYLTSNYEKDITYDTETYQIENLYSKTKNAYSYTPPDKPIHFKEKKVTKKRKKNRFRCDGRQYCSQMHSCAEATYFINYCPNTKMDGDGDGIPCERQWCGY